MKYSFFYSRGSAGYVRGEQIADLLGGKKNPKSGFDDDICIYVKVFPLGKYSKHTYIDVDDAPKAANYLKDHPDIGVIATSEFAKDYLSKLLNRDDIVVIPHAHCNYERWVRPDREIKTVGIIGSESSFQHDVDNFRERLEKIGLELSYEKDYWDTYRSTEDKPGRLKVVDFYKTIDIQVVWRPKVYAPYFKNPNKLINAGSFGIPTVSYPEASYVKEWGNDFICATSIDLMIRACQVLKEDDDYYDYWSKRVLAKAEECHKDNIIELYRRLK